MRTNRAPHLAAALPQAVPAPSPTEPGPARVPPHGAQVGQARLASGEGTQAAPPVFTRAAERQPDHITVADTALVPDPSGALYWPEEGMLAVADLHLEKGSSFATRGVLLPPYDTAATLARLARLTDRYQPRRVIALGDSFHDGGGPARVAPEDRAALRVLQRGRDWLWIAGNHDPDPPLDLGGDSAAMLALGPLVFRHEPSPYQAEGEIAGHLHPTARVAVRGHSIARRCFATDHRRVVMPAFGAYAGGLNVRHQAFTGLFDKTFVAHLLGERRTYAFAGSACLAD